MKRKQGCEPSLSKSTQPMDPAEASRTLKRIQVQTWFLAVAKASGKTAAALEREFHEIDQHGSENHADGEGGKLPRVEDDARRMRSKLPAGCWHRYKHGVVSPRSGDRPDGKPGLVERVDQRYPGTARVFHSALWRVADYAPMEMSEIRKVFEGFPEGIRSYFVVPPGAPNEIFWRHRGENEWIGKLTDSGSGVGQLSDCLPMDHLTAMLALIKEAETTQDPWKHAYWVRIAKRWMATRDETILGSSGLLSELADFLHLS